MPTYTTGEIAKMCGVTVRTVQYYDTRGILIPSSLSEGGRRLYAESDLRRMRIICFLRELGLSINAISQILSEENPEHILSLLIEQQKSELAHEIAAHQRTLDKLDELSHDLKLVERFSVESIGDMARRMENREALKRVRVALLAVAIPVSILQWVSIILWIVNGIWWLFGVWAVVALPLSVGMARHYFCRVRYICPQCHAVFEPRFKEAFFARHTPRTRKLTCPACGHRGFCVEVCAEEAAPHD